MASKFLSLSTPRDVAAGMKFIEDLTKNADRVQAEVLEEILKRNANTEYLKLFLRGQIDKELFKEEVPVVDYKDIWPFVERMANGSDHDRSHILTDQPISELFRSSGTSGGKQKLFPATAEDLDRIHLLIDLSFAVLKTHVDGLDEGKRMVFLAVLPYSRSPGGLIVRNAVSSIVTSKKTHKHPLNSFTILTSPDDVMSCADLKQNTYLQLLCGLVQRDQAVIVGAIFPTIFLRAIKFLEENWEELCANIKAGRISDWVTDSNGRKAASKILNEEMPDLANAIEELCRAESWEGIIRKLWPKTKIIETVVTGSMAQYIPTLEFYCGGLPLVSLRYASSECFAGINLKPLSQPGDVSYTLMPNAAYFEFLPVEERKKDERQNDIADPNCRNNGIVDLANVEIGQCYELVVTTFAGLYRYRVGDILMVTGFHNKAPQFRFVRRQNVILSIDVDKTTEEDLFKAVTKAMKILEPLGFLLHDYTSYNETPSVPGHYVLFWEIQPKKGTSLFELDATVMEKCCASVEQSLDAMYRKLRNWKNVIDPLEIRVVKQGTFDALMDFYLSQGSPATQYKTPKSIRSEKALQVLNSMVIESYSSKSVPH